MAKPKLSEKEQVDEHISKLDPEIRENVQLLREIILSTDLEIGERIKWNNPSMYYTGEMREFDPKEYKRDIVVFNLHKNRLMLVFPSGAKVNDASGLLQGSFKDERKTITFLSLEDVKAKAEHLQNIIKVWLSKIEK